MTDLIHSNETIKLPVKTRFPFPSREEIRERNQAAIELLRSWREEGDEEEQKETWEFLKKALDEDRLSYRKHFPEE